jgi:hypothetical protein
MVMVIVGVGVGVGVRHRGMVGCLWRERRGGWLEGQVISLLGTG